MQINTKFNEGDNVTDGIVTGVVTDVSVWVALGETEIEYRVATPEDAWQDPGHWVRESRLKEVEA